jgi:enoyl-CoA hydratase/carnithine racemase
VDYAAVNAALVVVERLGSITHLTLNRADKANALSAALVTELAAAINAAHDDGTTVLVIRGAGKNFCAGFDLSSLDTETDDTLIERLRCAELMLQSLYHAPFATVALIHGGAFGAGFDIAMACDYRVASHDAQFRMPGWRMGLALGTRRTVARVGSSAAFAFLRSAATIDAQAAINGGFITERADPVTWPRRIDEIEEEVKALPANGYARLKRLVLTDTREADLLELIESLRAAPLKPRMQNYVRSR